MRAALRGLVALGALALLAWPAAKRAEAAVGSNDYLITTPSGLYEAPPSGSSTKSVPINSTQVKYGARVDFPFPFLYFGRPYDHVWVTTYGYSRFGSDADVYSLASDLTALGVGSVADGACAPLWDFVLVQSTGRVKTWTVGTPPNRRVVVSYEDVAVNSNNTAHLTFQTKYYESGRIEFAYKSGPAADWSGLQYACGMDAPGADPRWLAPVNTATTNSGRPTSDYRFDPRIVNFTGRLLYDRLTPTTLGLSTTTTPVPASGLRVEVRNGDGTLNSVGVSDAYGYWAVRAPAGPPGGADLYAFTEGTACVVKAGGSATSSSWRVGQGLVFTSDQDLSTTTVDAGSDPAGVFRAPANIASAIQRARDFAQSKATHAIPQLSVTWSSASAATTRYTAKVGATAASMIVGGAASGNADEWDDAIVERVYGRHVLASIAQAPPTGSTYDDRFDVVTDPPNAFAVGFGCFLHAVVEHATETIDTAGPSSALVYDYEAPTLVSAPGPSVAGWVAAGLYDLADGANETWDWVDGTNSTSARVVQFSDVTLVVPTPLDFFKTWAGSGGDGAGISRDFARHALIADDALEPNDLAAEAAPIGAVTASSTARRDALVLNTGNEDWFSFTLPDPIDDLCAEVVFPRATYKTTLELQLLNAANGVVAAKIDDGNGVALLDVGATDAGSYRLGVRNVAGDIVPAYTVQVLRCLKMERTPLKSWTQGFVYEQAISVKGGVPPYTFVVRDGGSPPGIGFDPLTGRAAGTPTDPGIYDFTLDAKDAGDPQHVDSTTHHVVIAAPLSLDFGGYAAFAVGKAVSAARPHFGGTPPLAIRLDAGAPPAGLTLAADDVRFTGTPGTLGATVMTIFGRDVAGSTSTTDATAVVCAPLAASKTPLELPAHQPACGFYLDAVKGSTVGVNVSAVPGTKTKRALRMVLLGPDGLRVAGGKSVQGTNKAGVAGVIAPSTGRCFAVVAADDGEALSLLGTPSVKPPTKASGKFLGVAKDGLVQIQIGALDGAQLTFGAKTDKKSKLKLRIAAVVDSTGRTLPLTDIAKQDKHGGASLKTPLDASGTWTVFVAATSEEPQAGGVVTWSWKLKQPRGGVYSAD